MKREIEIQASPKEVAEMLFNLDNEQVASVFSEWKKLFDLEYERRKKEGETIWIFDLNHFMLYVIDKMDEDAKDFIRSSYASLVYRFCNDIHKKHILELNLL